MGRAFQRAQELYIELWHRVWWTVGTGQPLSPRLEQQHIPGFVTSQLEWDRAKVSSCLFEFVILQIGSTEKARRMQKVKLHQTMMKHDEVFGSWDLLCYDSNGADSAFSLHLYLGCQANLPVRDDVKGFNRSLDKHKSKILVEVLAMLKALAVAKSKTSTSIGYIMINACYLHRGLKFIPMRSSDYIACSYELERKHCDTGLESAEREGCRVETRHGVEWTSQVSQNSDWDVHIAHTNPYNTSFNFSFNLRRAKGKWLHSHWTLRIVAGIRLRQERAKGSWESSLGQLDNMGVSKNRGTLKWMVYIWFIMENPTKIGWFCGKKNMGLTFPRLQDAGYRASWEDAGVVGKAVYASGNPNTMLDLKSVA